MLLLLTIFGILCRTQSIPIETRNISLVLLPQNNDISELTTAEDITNAVSQVMTSLKSNNKSSGLIEAIINEVQLQIKRDPSLPRLTRGEILDLIENITKSDVEKFEKMKRDRNNHQRAVMLVLPYSPKNNSDSNMEELYTKPPIVKIIDDKTEKPKNGVNLQEMYTEPPVLKLIDDQVNRSEMKPVRRRRPTLPPTIPKMDSTTTKSSQNYHQTTEIYKNINDKEELPSFLPTPTPTNSPISEKKKFTKFPIMKKYSVKIVNKEITTSRPDNNYFSSQGFNIIAPPKLNVFPDSKKNEFNEVPEEILIAEESLPLKRPQSNIVDNIKIQNGIINGYENFPKLPDISGYTPPVSDLEKVADNLTPEMQQLLTNFGLIPEKNKHPVKYETEQIYVEPEKPYYAPESFVQFKPLPDNAPVAEDMANFLRSFGIESRNMKEKKTVEKSNKNENDSSPKEIEIDIFPKEMKGIFDDLGLSDRQGKKVSISGIENYHKPIIKHSQELEELKQLKILVNLIKKIETSNITEKIDQKDLEQINTLVNSLSTSKNPLDYSKLNVKRQIIETVSESSVSTEAPKINLPTSTEILSTSTADATPNLKDLEDSFGGTSSTTTTTTEPASTTRKSGFYHLVDWNTFLEVDDQRGKRVNIRYQPRSGDPKRFFSVKVP